MILWTRPKSTAECSSVKRDAEAKVSDPKALRQVLTSISVYAFRDDTERVNVNALGIFLTHLQKFLIEQQRRLAFQRMLIRSKGTAFVQGILLSRMHLLAKDFAGIATK